MAEIVYEKNYHGTLLELVDHSGALEKFSRVRISLLALKNKHSNEYLFREEVPRAIAYFCKRYLGGQGLKEVSVGEYNEAISKLSFAVGIPNESNPADGEGKPTGCYMRCLRLAKQLNEYAKQEGYPEVDVEKDVFPFYSFWEEPIMGDDGWPEHDQNGRIKTKFTNQRHLDSFRRELLKRLKNGEKPTFQEIDEEIRKRFKLSS